MFHTSHSFFRSVCTIMSLMSRNFDTFDGLWNEKHAAKANLGPSTLARFNVKTKQHFSVFTLRSYCSAVKVEFLKMPMKKCNFEDSAYLLMIH